MSYTFPEMPKEYFDINKWFTCTFQKNDTTGNTIGYKFNYEDHLNLFLNAKFTSKENVIYVIDAFDNIIHTIPLEEYKKYVSCGEWDDPTFTKNERKLAWQIECLRVKQSIKKINEEDLFECKKENNVDDDFDFGFYDFVENTDNMPIHLRNTLLNSIVDKNDKESFSWIPPSKPPRISSLTS
jgi:hypothetical protein